MTSDPHIVLSATTGIAEIDRLLVYVVSQLHTLFGNRVRGYYLVGSYAMGCPVTTSDVDVVALFVQQATEEERNRFRMIVGELQARAPLQIDITSVDEAELLQHGATRFKFASKLLYGKDIRPSLPIRPLAMYARSEMAGGATALFRTRGNPAVLDLPLAAPRAADEFLGYASRSHQLPDGTKHASTKDLVLAVVLIGTSIVAAQAHQYVHHKSLLFPIYQACIGDEWSDHIEAVYTVCRDQWAYQVPEEQAARRRLRDFCEHELAFEQAFVRRFQAFCVHEQHHGNHEWAERQLARFKWG